MLVGAAAAALVIAIAPAVAQVAPPPGVAQGTAPAPPMAAPHVVPQVRMRMMSDRVMTRAEVVRHVSDMFARLDTNKDGYITRGEVDALHQKMVGAMGMAGDMQHRLAERGIMMGDRSAIFDRLDTNHDGNISRQEFMAGHGQAREARVMILSNREGVPGAAPPPGVPGMRMHMHGMGAGMGMGIGRLFDMADANHDGRVSLAEAQAAALAHFDKADVNHDGRITPDEHRHVRIMRMDGRPS
jgi:Ca2+-binding EF-hand superfamily protein